MFLHNGLRAVLRPGCVIFVVFNGRLGVSKPLRAKRGAAMGWSDTLTDRTASAFSSRAEFLYNWRAI